MVGTSVDAVLCTSPDNIYYYSGFRTTLYTRFVAVLIRIDRPDSPILIVSTIDKRMIEERIWSPPWVTDIVFHGPDQQPGIQPTPEAALKANLGGIKRLGVDSLRLAEVDLLNQAAPNINIVQVSAQLDEGKKKKDEQEVALLRKANLLAMQGMEKVCQMLAGGPVTEIEISVQLEADARLAGADGFGYPTLVSSGAKMAAIHSPALNRLAESNHVLRVAFGPTIEGYTADIVRTFCVGKPPKELISLQDGYLEAFEKLLGMIRPGVNVINLFSAVEDIYTKWGVRSYWMNSIGHGVGMTIHEQPRIAKGSQAVLSEGMVIAVEPFLVMPGFGGYAQCDVIALKESGPELLAPGKEGIILVSKGY
jgi:Xaa-Pro aminopeptidase